MATTSYQDFILIAGEPSADSQPAFSLQVFDSPVGQGERVETVTIPPDLSARIDDLLGQRLNANLGAQIELGEMLAALILPPYARSLFTASQSRLKSGEGLRLRLRLPDQLAAYPWEFALVQELRGERTASSFLLLDTRLSILRELALPFPPDEESGPVESRRVLVTAAAPAGLPPLPGLPAEAAAIRTTLSQVPGLRCDYLPDFTAPSPLRMTAQNLGAALQLHARTDIFHFSGHAVFRQASGAPGMGFLALEDETGGLATLPADRLCELLRSHGVRLVFLNACQTAQRDSAAMWNSLAAAMLKARIPAVLAMGTRVRDDLAAAFSAAFYRALVAGYPTDYAVAVGRQAIRSAPGAGDAVDWGVPVLYARGGPRPLFAAVQDAAARARAEAELPGLPAVHVEQHIGSVSGAVIGTFHGNIENMSFVESAGSPPAASTPPAARFCTHCGEQLRPAARFCPRCGAQTSAGPV